MKFKERIISWTPFIFVVLIATTAIVASIITAKSTYKYEPEINEIKQTVLIQSNRIKNLEDELIELRGKSYTYGTAHKTEISYTEEIDTEEIEVADDTEEEIIEMEVPNIDTSIKYFTDYRFYNIAGSPHRALQQECWTDEYGCRRFNNDYCVALGSYYSTSIGDRFEVTLDTGVIFTVIMADGKWDIDCDFKNQYMPCYDYDGNKCGNLLEFIVDDTVVDTEVYEYGSLDYYDFFKGSVVGMKYLGRDSSQDWGS